MPRCSRLSSEQIAHVKSILGGYSKAALACEPNFDDQEEEGNGEDIIQ